MLLRRIPTLAALAALVAVVLASTSPGQPGAPSGPPPGVDPPGWANAIEAKERHAARLLDMPGVAGIGVGVNKAGKPVIRVFKETDVVAGLPAKLDDVPVESVVTGVIEIRAPTDRFPRPVPIGVSSGHLNTATGTLGARVRDASGHVYALSNNHVYAAINGASIGDGIIQPGNVDGGSDPADRIGTLHDFQQINFTAGSTNTMDAAIAITTSADVGVATPPDGYGAPSEVTTQAFVGQAVQKYGRTTGFQLGNITATNVSVDVCYVFFVICFQQARFVNQITISPDAFSAGGDSGSLIVTQGGNQPVALLFAGGEGLTIGNPIDLVLQRFGVTIDGTVPPAGPPSAPTGLSALAGDASIALSWTAPYNGGQPITNYKVYRGDSSGAETFLANAGTSTTYSDSGLTNGSTYYYKVSAQSVLGEGPQSNEASATPSAADLPVEPLPVIDSFDRPDESPLSDAGRWSNGVNGSGESGLQVTSNAVGCNKTSTCTAWRNTTQYGPDTEVWARVSTLPGVSNQIRLKARLQQVGTTGYDGYMLRTNQLSGTDQVWIDRVDNGVIVNLLTVSRELAAGDLMLLRVMGSNLEAWHRAGSTWSRLGTVTDATYPAAGFTGIGVRGTTGRLDDFGARNAGPPPPPTAPGAPTNLQAVPGNTTVSLTWTAPASDGGVPLTGYKIYRGENGGAKSLLTTVGTTPTSFQDSGLTNGTLYAYQVSAVNQVPLEGALSNEASATPADLPVEPLPVVDSFNRSNETLSDAGRWTNGVVGSGETGLQVTSNTLSCSKTSTCTAWRNTAQYGPDTEVWARVSTLPGASNQIRLYARLQQVGSSGYDGYMLRTNQLSGTDQVWIDRVDNGTIVNRLTVNRELAVGDVMLLRAVGSTLELWQRSGATWSRLGTVADSTYSAAGYAGIGLRGTTGRLDDFGVRNLGPPPPPSAPGAPTTLQAQPGNTTVSLTWTAPASDGGVPLTGYRIYRGENGGAKSLLTTVGTSPTSFQDSGLANGTPYSYAVSAVNQAPLEGALSNEASATPSADFPLEPLPVIDSFDRPNENPLSDGGRWSHGVNGSGESGLQVVSNTVGCTKNWTCTAWRNTAQYGPDTEAWATVTTLPGNGNSMRIYVRLQSPGSSSADGYLLFFTQSSGTDQVAIYRLTNGGLTSLVSVNREVVVGNRLLMRAKGSTLEAWVQAGSIWTRVAQVTDSTYSSGGYAGIGVRLKTGRLNDFGAR